MVRALNLVLEDTVEFRVREVLEEKLAVILREFGVDKTGDVLDSADAGEIFDELYRDAIMNPADVESRVESVLTKVRAQADAMRRSTSLSRISSSTRSARPMSACKAIATFRRRRLRSSNGV